MQLAFNLHNLACPMCAAAVQATVAAVPGVSNACAHFSSRKLVVEGENLNSADIVTAVRESGSDIDAELDESGEGDEEGPHRHEDADQGIINCSGQTTHATLDDLCGSGCACSFKRKPVVAEAAGVHVYDCPEYLAEFDQLESAWDESGHEHGNTSTHVDSGHKKDAVILIFSAVLFVAALLWDNFDPSSGSEPQIWLIRLMFAVPYLLCGWVVFKGAWESLKNGSIFNEFSLMAIATLAAIGLDQLPEAVGVMLFYRVGEFFQELALNRSRSSIKGLLAARPSSARLLNSDGTIRSRAVEKVLVGENIVVRPGEKVPLDGEIIAGHSQFDTSPLTGEPKPLSAKPGDDVLAGYINLDSMLTLKVTAPFKDSQISRILGLVEDAAKRKAAPERFVTRFARVYTPIVVVLAVLVACLPPLLGGAQWHEWIYRALVLLVISCPCALVISIPLSYFGGIGGASRRGILVKGGLVLDMLKDITTVVFDKTGTLTRGVFEVTSIEPVEQVSEQQLLYAAALAEMESNHPVARSIMQHVGDVARPADLAVQELAGRGMLSKSGGRRYLAGNAELMREHGLDIEAAAVSNIQGTVVYVAEDDRFLGTILVSDALRPESAQAIADLKALGLKTIMLTGDRAEGAAWVAEATGIDDYRAGLLPAQKVETLESLADPKTAAFVGDGVNDAPILALSGIGIAMGGAGSEVAVEASDAVILNDSPSKVVELFGLGKKVRAVVWQNIALAVGVKVLFMTLGIIGLSGLWEAVFADVGVALLAVLNAGRAVRI